jgi:hypothetical protein
VATEHCERASPCVLGMDDADDALLARFNRIMSGSGATMVESMAGEQGVATIVESTAGEQGPWASQVRPSAESTGRRSFARPFPSVPSSEPAALPPSSIGESVQSKAEHAWCRICRNTARVWCVDCGDEAYCAMCWREVHVGVVGGLRADAGLRLHTTVPCRGLQLAAAMPAVPSARVSLPEPEHSATRRSASPQKLQCQTCNAAAYTRCLDCDSHYCASCWRSIHVFPNSDIVRHRRSALA